ncbi:hypothetical protein [Szabonella alba]|uniref:Uncharacterized protein n=1 Tax=Szabonella alba TaxID=2804194 RepID=A0A8K0VG68_9RHOB|nr:hypothetical protein [Szabonella alba]MBL4919190.1 hypothetical protein [Szabonella alba]
MIVSGLLLEARQILFVSGFCHQLTSAGRPKGNDILTPLHLSHWGCSN